MVKIVDHAYEPETTIRSNQAKIKKALAKKEKVVVLHSEGFVHGRLAGIPGVEYKVLKGLPRRREVNLKKLSTKLPTKIAPSISVQDSELLSRFIRRRDAAFLARFYEEYEAFMVAYAKNNGWLESSGS